MSGWRTTPLARTLGRHATAWDALNARSFGNHPLLTSLFVDGLLRNFGDGSEYLCTCYRDGRMEAMCIVQRGRAMQWVSFVPSQAQIAPTMIAQAALVPGLLAILPGFALQLDLLCNDPAVGGVLQDTRPACHRLNHALTMNVSLAGSFEAYWSERARHLQSNMKRYDKRVAADGMAQRFASITDTAAMSGAIERYVALEGAGWKGRKGTAIGSKPEQYRFYRDLMLQASQEGNAMVCELWFGERLAASRLILRQGQVHVMLKTGYDENLSTYSPGRLLLLAVIENAFASFPGELLEFYTDADANLLEWCTGKRWIQHATQYRWPVAAIAMVGLNSFKPGGNGDDHDIEVYTHPGALPAEVQAFLAKAEKRNFELGCAWYGNLVDTVYPAHEGIRFYVLRRAGQLAAVLPLRIELAGKRWQVHSLSNFYTSLYEPAFDASLKSAELVPLLSALGTDFPGLDSIQLSPMDPESHAWRTLLGALRAKGWVPFDYFAFGNWFQAMQGSAADYLAARENQIKNTIRRMGKKLAADGGTLELVTEPKDIARGIAAWEQVYGASWKKPEPFPEFVPGLLHSYAGKGTLRLGLAWKDGQPIAAQLWIVAHGRASIYKLAYDEQYKGYSPGTLITAMLMAHVIDKDKVAEIDYLIGDDPYKKSWLNQRRERRGIVAYNPRTPRGLVRLLREAGGRAIHAMHDALSS
ncbi:MAG: GNAT family N-acetyltransferase [Pseudomonadota bacterium]